MGEACKHRLTLIKSGKAQEAKTHRIAPERLTNLTAQMETVKAEILNQLYKDKVDKQTCPTFNSFLCALIEAGAIEFEKFYLEQNAPRPDIEVNQPDQPELPLSGGDV